MAVLPISSGEVRGMDDRPLWARRIRREREIRGWSQADAVAALRAHSDRELVRSEHLLRRWKSWEAGEHLPDAFYQRLIAKTFGTVRGALFPIESRRRSHDLVAATGMNTVDLLSRLRSSDVDNATLDAALRIVTERLCSDYVHLPADQLVTESRSWLGRIVDLLDHRLTLVPHREVLTLAGWLALLTGCVEYDMGLRRHAEATRAAVLSLAKEADNREVAGWAYEMSAWFALTKPPRSDHRGTSRASSGRPAQRRGPARRARGESVDPAWGAMSITPTLEE
jgi:hypothetical protein